MQTSDDTPNTYQKWLDDSGVTCDFIIEILTRVGDQPCLQLKKQCATGNYACYDVEMQELRIYFTLPCSSDLIDQTLRKCNRSFRRSHSARLNDLVYLETRKQKLSLSLAIKIVGNQL